MRSSIAVLKATEKVPCLPSGKQQELVYAQRQTSAHSEDEFMSATKSTPVSNVETSGYEPFELDGKPFGTVRWLRTESGGEGMLLAGFWKYDVVADLPYFFSGDETVHVLEGEVTVDIEGGDAVTLRPGDVASFTKGQTATWRIKRPFKKFFVVSG